MNDSRDSEDAATVVVECDLPEPPEKVWRALTEPELVAEWLTSNDDDADERAPIECAVIEAKPNRLVRYSWRDVGQPGSEDEGGLDSIVTFELARTAAGGTHLRIIHTAFEQTPALAMAA
jgi:uncharacterized protein YndB with AHSA1/START domain